MSESEILARLHELAEQHGLPPGAWRMLPARTMDLGQSSVPVLPSAHLRVADAAVVLAWAEALGCDAETDVYAHAGQWWRRTDCAQAYAGMLVFVAHVSTLEPGPREADRHRLWMASQGLIL